MRISDWSSDVCSSDLRATFGERQDRLQLVGGHRAQRMRGDPDRGVMRQQRAGRFDEAGEAVDIGHEATLAGRRWRAAEIGVRVEYRKQCQPDSRRSEEHTSELQSLMRISYAVFCLK